VPSCAFRNAEEKQNKKSKIERKANEDKCLVKISILVNFDESWGDVGGCWWMLVDVGGCWWMLVDVGEQLYKKLFA